MQFIPIVERVTPEMLALSADGWGGRRRPLYTQSGDQVTARSVGAEQYGRFLVDVFEEWARRDVGDVFVQIFDTALAHWLGMDKVGLCVHARTCGDAVALEHNGDLYSCDHFVEPDYLLGNITAGRTLLQMVESPQQRAFGNAKLDTLPQYCLDCDVRFACNGGCPKDRFATAPTGEPGLHYLCAGYKVFFGHVAQPMSVMADLLRAGQEAVGLRDWYAQPTPPVRATIPARAAAAGNGRGATGDVPGVPMPGEIVAPLGADRDPLWWRSCRTWAFVA